MNAASRARRALTRSCTLVILAGCAGSPATPDGSTPTGDHTSRLAPCPALPNCVLSDAANPVHAIAPIRLTGDPAETWVALLAHLESDSQYTIVERSDDYVRAEARTRVVGFVDDVEFLLREARGEIAVRSASRVGLFDLGVNRIRIEGVRRALDGA